MNTWPGCKIKPVSEDKTNEFAQIVKNAGFIVTVRRSGGADQKSLSDEEVSQESEEPEQKQMTEEELLKAIEDNLNDKKNTRRSF